MSIDIESFIHDNMEILKDPFWIYKKAKISSELVDSTCYKSKMNIKPTFPKRYNAGDSLSTLWVSGGTFILSSVFQISLDMLFQWTEKYIVKNNLSIYLLHSTFYINHGNLEKDIYNTAFDITARSFLKYKDKAEKKYSSLSLAGALSDSISLFKNGNLSFSNMLDKGAERIDRRKEEYILKLINLMTVTYIVNAYYLFDLSDSYCNELLSKYSFNEYEDLLRCRSDNSDQINLSIYNIDNEYDSRSKFHKYFNDKYSHMSRGTVP